MTAPGQLPISYVYDAASQPTQITQGSDVVTFEYDGTSRRTRTTLPNQVSTEYQYDAASRLTALIYRNATNQLGNLTYQYDPSGNRTQVGSSFARTQLPDAVASATYDAANRQLTFGSLTLDYDANGNLTSDGSATYAWDARNRLVGLRGPGATASFQYDQFGRRVRKVTNGSMSTYLYDGDNLLQELSGAGGLVRILSGLGLDEYFARVDAAGSQVALISDALRSTVALTDAAGTIQTQYTYDPFGSVSVSGGSSENALQYTARENDGTGLHYYRLRYYDPRRQRFISQDPIGFAGGDLNLYAYVRNRPTFFVDPYGLWCADCHERQTLARAVACGLSAGEAQDAARANKQADTRHPVESVKPKSPQHAMPGSEWRRYAAAQLALAIKLDKAGNTKGAMRALGAGLHAIQDAWAHDLRHPYPGTLTEHVRGVRPERQTPWVSPDSPEDNPWEWSMSARATEEYIKDFLRGRGQKPTCD